MVYEKKVLGRTKWGEVEVIGYPARIFFFSIEFAILLRVILDPEHPLDPSERVSIIRDLLDFGLPIKMTNGDERMHGLLNSLPIDGGYAGKVRLYRSEPSATSH